MLEVDEQKVVAGALHDAADFDTAHTAHAHAQGELTLLQALLGGINDGWHESGLLLGASVRATRYSACAFAHCTTCAWVANHTSPSERAWRISSSRIQMRERYPITCGCIVS